MGTFDGTYVVLLDRGRLSFGQQRIAADRIYLRKVQAKQIDCNRMVIERGRVELRRRLLFHTTLLIHNSRFTPFTQFT